MQPGLTAWQASDAVAANVNIVCIIQRVVRDALQMLLQAIAPYGGQVTEMLQHCCGDSYHEACMQACHSIQNLVESVGMMLFGVSKHLMAAVMPLLTHKRHKASP